MANPLDDLPLDVLMALLGAGADPSSGGRERAEHQALEAGFLLRCTAAPPDPPGVVVPLPEATLHELALTRAQGVDRPMIVLDFEQAPRDELPVGAGVLLRRPAEA